MRLLLGSKSPRRSQILKNLHLDFEVVEIDAEESYPDDIPSNEVAEYLAIKKASAYSTLQPAELLITADTTVILDDEVINKPENKEDAIQMLQKLSGRTHEVVTGVCLKTSEFQKSFSDSTKVEFNKLDLNEILYYLSKCKPYDKAGSYGVQDWIGLSCIKKMDGNFYTVMGFPSNIFYNELKKLGIAPFTKT